MVECKWRVDKSCSRCYCLLAGVLCHWRCCSATWWRAFQAAPEWEVWLTWHSAWSLRERSLWVCLQTENTEFVFSLGNIPTLLCLILMSNMYYIYRGVTGGVVGEWWSRVKGVAEWAAKMAASNEEMWVLCSILNYWNRMKGNLINNCHHFESSSFLLGAAIAIIHPTCQKKLAMPLCIQDHVANTC